MVDNVLHQLEDEGFFVARVGAYFRTTPDEMKAVVDFTVEVDDARLAYAHTEYLQGIEKFSLLLHSRDPDHYKRCGALLHALYQSRPIVSALPTPELDGVDTLCTPLGQTYADGEKALEYAQLYQEYHNELTAFAFAYGCCRQYEASPREIDLEYIRTVCTYLKNNANLSIESLFMMFKALMQ